MKLNENLILREVAGEYMIVNPFSETMDMTQILTLNETAAWLWQQAEGKEFDEAYLVDCLCEEYDVDRETAATDASNFVMQLLQHGMIQPSGLNW